MHFLASFFVLLSVIIHQADHLHLRLNILKVVPVSFLTAVFSFFRFVSVNFIFTLSHQTINAIHRNFAVPVSNVASVDFSKTLRTRELFCSIPQHSIC